jgi:hypothetical protein
MMGDPNCPENEPHGFAANDNAGGAASDVDASRNAVFKLARMFGRQIARQHFAAIRADNDNNEAKPNTDT